MPDRLDNLALPSAYDELNFFQATIVHTARDHPACGRGLYALVHAVISSQMSLDLAGRRRKVSMSRTSTVRRWFLKFGRTEASGNLRRSRPQLPAARWHLDEMVIRIREPKTLAVAKPVDLTKVYSSATSWSSHDAAPDQVVQRLRAESCHGRLQGLCAERRIITDKLFKSYASLRYRKERLGTAMSAIQGDCSLARQSSSSRNITVLPPYVDDEVLKTLSRTQVHRQIPPRYGCTFQSTANGRRCVVD